MTVKELIDAAPFCDSAEIVVRTEGSGQWIQGYRIGKDIYMFPCEYTIEVQETLKGDTWNRQIDGRNQPPLTKGEIRDIFHGSKLPMKLIKKDVSRLPENVAGLTVSSFQPRHIPSFHLAQLTHNDFLLEINAYPEGYEFTEEQEKEEKTKDNQIAGQVSLMDLLEE